MWLGPGEALRFPPHETDWGRRGWAAYFSDVVEEANAQVLVRFGVAGNTPLGTVDPAAADPLVVHETVVRVGADGGTATAALVREIPLARLEAAANLYLAQLPRPVSPEAFPFLISGQSVQVPGFFPREPWTNRPAAGRRRGPSLKLRIPSGQKRPDSFYQQVAERYLWLTSQGKGPADELAAANDVPASTVHRWVREARRRGILVPGQRGRAQ